MKEITLTEDIKMLSYPFDGSGNIFGFTTTRHGGVSGGSYASLNLGAFAGDDAGNVAENRNRLCRSIGIDSRWLFLPHQVHGSDLLYIDDAFLTLPEARQQELLDGKDAVITTVKKQLRRRNHGRLCTCFALLPPEGSCCRHTCGVERDGIPHRFVVCQVYAGTVTGCPRKFIRRYRPIYLRGVL